MTPQAPAIAEIEAVRKAITGVAHHIDQRRWSELRSLFADKVIVDYTSLLGGEVQTQNADDLIATWRKMLTPLNATQHLLGPIDAEVRERVATATCHVRGYHLAKGVPGGNEWMVAGHYIFKLAKEDVGWKIGTMTLQTLYQSGNTQLLQEVAAQAPRSLG
jgi:hypothetical protein